MLQFAIKRLWQSAILLLIVTVITFFLMNLSPGGPSSMMRMDATEAERQAIAEQYGLDRPVVVRYFAWLGNALTGDLGLSFSTGLDVTERISERLPNTFELAFWTLIFSVVVGIIFGTIAAIKRNSLTDYSINFGSTIGLSIPSFWLAIMLILVFSVNLQWLPSSGIGTESLSEKVKSLIMPVLILSTAILPTIVRFTRSSVLEVISQDFIRTARSKGLKEKTVIYTHALRNALIPIISIIGVLIPRLLSGTVIVESVFGWPGMGRLIVEAAQGRDYNLVMGVTVVVTIVVIFTSFVVDLVYSKIDPRVKNI